MQSTKRRLKEIKKCYLYMYLQNFVSQKRYNKKYIFTVDLPVYFITHFDL